MKMMSDTNTNKITDFRVAGIGEILWDFFPHAQRLGGAPTNFACHCNQLGAGSYPVSSVGSDDLGHQASEELIRLGVDVAYLQTSDQFPTGRVLVALDETGKPSYQILDDVAWDYTTFTDELKNLSRTLDAVCFGVLAQRSDVTRQTIHSFLKQMPESAVKILDVNLRAPFYSKPLIEESLKLATVLKLSDEELPVLAKYFKLRGSEAEQLASLRKRFDLDLVAYTQGADGSQLIAADEINITPALKITPVDSVGAGDSFTAALCIGLLQKWSLKEINLFANKVAAFVCSQYGATPELPAELIYQKVDV